jgi:peptide/nickel transport system ATP-binding protein
VFAKRAHPYTRGLQAARPRLGATRGTTLPTIPGRVPELADLPAGCAFAERCDRVVDDCRRAPPPAVDIGAQHIARCIRVQVTPP